MGDLERLLRPIGRAARRQPIGRTDPRSAAQARPHAPTRYASVPPTRERHGVFEGPPVCIDVLPAMLRSGPLQVSAGEETQGRPQDLRRAGRASSARPYVTSRGSCNSPRHRGQHSGWHDAVVFRRDAGKDNAKGHCLVQDNLNIHSRASLCEAFRPPKLGGSSLQMALHAKTWQLAGLGRIRTRHSIFPVSRPPHSRQIPIDEIGAWEHERNANHAEADWHFIHASARIKLKHFSI
jgi:hypothetical protein